MFRSILFECWYKIGYFEFFRFVWILIEFEILNIFTVRICQKYRSVCTEKYREKEGFQEWLGQGKLKVMLASHESRHLGWDARMSFNLPQNSLHFCYKYLFTSTDFSFIAVFASSRKHLTASQLVFIVSLIVVRYEIENSSIYPSKSKQRSVNCVPPFQFTTR